MDAATEINVVAALATNSLAPPTGATSLQTCWFHPPVPVLAKDMLVLPIGAVAKTWGGGFATPDLVRS